MGKSELLNSLKRQGFSLRILDAFRKVKREDFVEEKLKKYAYLDTRLPIGFNQTISQPSTIAFMLSLLETRNKQKILEVGSGSGYVLALLSQLSPQGKIIGVERISELVESSRNNLTCYPNVRVVEGDGSKKFLKEAPFDRILVSASSEKIPQDLVEQLKFRGKLVAPVKNSIVSLKKLKDGNEVKKYPGFVFVPLIENE